MPRNHTNHQPSRATGDDRPPKTLTMTHHHHARSTTATTTRKVRVSFTASSHELKTPKRPQNDRLQPRKAHNDDGHPKTLTTTPPSPRSIDNGHHHPQVRASLTTSGYEQQTPKRPQTDRPQPRKAHWRRGAPTPASPERQRTSANSDNDPTTTTLDRKRPPSLASDERRSPPTMTDT